MRLTILKALPVFILLSISVQTKAQSPAFKIVFDSLFSNNLMDDAIALSEKIEREEQLNGPSISLAHAINRKGYAWFKKGDWVLADSLFRESIAVATAAGQTTSLVFVDLLNNLAKHSGRMGNLQESLELFEQILQIQTALLGEENQQNISVRYNIGLTYFRMTRFDKSLEIYLESINSYEQNHWKKGDQFADLCRAAALSLSGLGRFSASKPYFLKALDLLESIHGKGSERYTLALYNYCYSMFQSGNYADLEPTSTALVEILRKLPNSEQSEIMELSLNILGSAKYMMGLYAEGITILLEAKKVAEACCGLGLEQRSEVSSNLAQAYAFNGQFELAFAEALEANKIDAEKLKNGQPISLVESANRAVVFCNLRKPEEARASLEKIENTADLEGQYLPEIQISCQIAKAQLAYLEKDYGLAISWLDSAIQSTALRKGPNSGDAISLMTDKSRFFYLAGNYKESLSTMNKMLLHKKQLVLAHNVLFSDSERSQLTDQFTLESSILADIAQQQPESSAVQQLIDLQLFKKNIAEKTSRKLAAIVQKSNIPELTEAYNQWIDTREQWNFAIQDPNSSPQQLEALQKTTELLEKKMARQGLGGALPDKPVFWTDIRAALKPSEAAVEVIRYNKLGDWDYGDSIFYAFLIIRPGEKTRTEAVFLKNGSELESFVMGQYQSEVIQKKDLSIILFNKMWASIAVKLQGVKTLYFSPDGIYHKINLNTLRYPDGTYLLEKMELRQVTNLQNTLLQVQEISGATPGIAVLFGNPNFKANANTPSSEAVAKGSQNADAYRVLQDSRTDLRLNPLPGSEREVNNIAKQLVKKNWETEVFTSTLATEETLKRLKSPKVLHIATHGYFMNSEKTPTRIGLFASTAAQNPAMRSMLFFAGAENNIEGSSSSSNDGILTAFEAAVLQLDNTELVVLSSCNTGLGKIQNGEGVLGLQRAFRIAGARSLIMSLWEVEDAATALLMRVFYENWTSGMSKTEAFHNAQLTLKTKYPEPFYWGSFILVNG